MSSNVVRFIIETFFELLLISLISLAPAIRARNWYMIPYDTPGDIVGVYMLLVMITTVVVFVGVSTRIILMKA